MSPGSACKVYNKREKLGPLHRSTGPVEMLLRVQNLYKTEYVTASQRVECSCALDPTTP